MPFNIPCHIPCLYININSELVSRCSMMFPCIAKDSRIKLIIQLLGDVSIGASRSTPCLITRSHRESESEATRAQKFVVFQRRRSVRFLATHTHRKASPGTVSHIIDHVARNMWPSKACVFFRLESVVGYDIISWCFHHLLSS